MIASSLSIILWIILSGAVGNVIVCADDQNVLYWIRRVKANERKAGRILKVAIDYLVKHNDEVSTRYLRSAHIISAEWLTRWAEPDIMDWLRRERTMQVGVPSGRIRSLGVTFNNSDGHPRIIQQRGQVICFFSR